MLIYLLRHGDAVQQSSLHDSDRPLTEIGRRQAAAVSAFIKKDRLSIQNILCSPLVRAQETAEPLRRGLGIRQIELSEYLVPGSDKRQLLDLLNRNGEGNVLLVGHSPHLGELISLIVAGKEQAGFDLKKCSLACVAAARPVRPGQGLLQWLLEAQHLERLASCDLDQEKGTTWN